ncbi:MAG: hypothetical protein MUE81_06500, partial [Thermoflexibacter sp.]|nr:hypothetical protein [Thermoflexibacter sp.]
TIKLWVEYDLALENAVREFTEHSLFEDKKYVLFYPQIGKNYSESKHKIMVIGRCLNGWDNACIIEKGKEKEALKRSKCRSEYNDFPLNWKGKTDKDTFNGSTSRFWAVTKSVTQKLLDLKDNEGWVKNIIWTNIYKISPQKNENDKKVVRTVNPKEIEIQEKAMFELLKMEIEILKPCYVLMVMGRRNNDWGWRFYHNFLNIKHEEMNHCKDNDIITRSFEYQNIKFVVTRRPDSLKDKYNKENFVNEIINAFKKCDWC